MVYEPLKVRETVFQDYRVSVPASEPDLVQSVRDLIKEGKRIYRETVAELPNIYFDRHIYQPLLLQTGTHAVSSPPGLNPGETRFVADLRNFLKSDGNRLLKGKRRAST